MNKFTAVANLAHFLLEQKGSVLATWKGKMSAKQQRELFGTFMGKGEIFIDGEREVVLHTVKVAYGRDYETTFESKWSGINEELARKEQWHKERKLVMKI